METRALYLFGLFAALVATVSALVAAGRAREGGRGLLRRLVGPLAARLRPSSQEDLDRLVTRLLGAGRRHRDDVDRFLEEKVLWLAGGLVTGVLAAAVVHGMGGILLLAIALLIGILGPDKRLEAQAARRRAAVMRGLPGAVDLLVTCLEAGLSLEQAIARVAAELSHSEPLLAEELRLTASEFEAGVSLPDALRRLARRVSLDDLSALCGVIAQASALGAPIAQTLREYAVSSRKARLAQLEERAGKVGAQLTIPLALCLLPAAMAIILGPAAIQLIQALR